MTILELCSIQGHTPPPLPSVGPLDANVLYNVKSLWRNTYSSGLCRLLETTFFNEVSLERAIFDTRDELQRPNSLTAEFAHFYANILNDTYLNDPAVHSQEARLIWTLADTCRNYTNRDGSEPPSTKNDSIVVSQRLGAIEALITGEYLEMNPLLPSSRYGTPEMQQLSIPAQLVEHELEFWFCLGEFVRRDPQSISHAFQNPPPRPEICLARMRTVLDQYENRDVLYSIATMRYIGEIHSISMSEDSHRAHEDRVSYFVARGFLESHITKGSNQIIQRFCEMAIQAFSY